MEINWIRPFLLSISLCALGGVTYWLEFRHKPNQEAQEENAKHIFALKDTSIKSIRIVSKAFDGLIACKSELCKAGEKATWELQSPKVLSADGGNVHSLVSALSTLSSQDTIHLDDVSEEKKTKLLAEYGFNNAQLVEVITDHETITLELGTKHPVGDTLFARKNGKEIYLIPGYFVSHLEHPLTYWRNKKLFTLSSHEIDSFAIETSSKIDAKRADGWLVSTAGKIYPGDQESIDAILNAALFLQAKDFIYENKKDAPRLKKLGTLILRKEKSESTLTLFEADKKKLYATVSDRDPVYELDAAVKERLFKSVAELRRSKLITAMERFGIKKIAIHNGKTGAGFQLTGQTGKTGTEWLEGKTKIPLEKVQAFLEQLSSAHIKDILTESEEAHEPLTITLGDDLQPEKKRLLFWKKGDRLLCKDSLSKRPNDIFALDSMNLPFEKSFFETK